MRARRAVRAGRQRRSRTTREQASSADFQDVGRISFPPHCADAKEWHMSKELLLVVDAVANEKGVPKEVIFDAMEAALASAAKKRYPEEDVSCARRDRSRERRLRDVPPLGSGRRRRGDGIAGPADPPDGRGRREARHRGRRVHRGADRESGIRPHLRAGRQAGHRAARARSRARAGRRRVQGSRRRTDHRHRQARRARQRLPRPGRQRRGLRAARPQRFRAKPCAPAIACAAICTRCARSRAVRSCSCRAPRPNS